MNGMALLGILLLAYAVLVVWIAVKKPKALWDMAKIRMFRKWFGEQGTVIFFFCWAIIATGFGIWLLIK